MDKIISAEGLGGHFPRHVNIETVNFCNARCPFCPLFQGNALLDRRTRPAGVMSRELFRSILEEIGGWHPQPTLTINMDGEPLMDPHFAERMAVLGNAGLAQAAHIETNGHLLDKTRAAAILQARLGEVRYAFDGATKATYERHRARCDFERVLRNLRQFVAERDRLDAPTRVMIKFTRTDDNVGEVADCYAMMNEFMNPAKDLFVDTITHSWAQRGMEEISLYNVAKVRAQDYKAGGCSLANSRMVIFLDGRVPGCSLDYNFFTRSGGFGNVSSGVANVWRSTAFEDFRHELANAGRAEIPETCARCINLYETPDEYPGPVIDAPDIVLWSSPYNHAYRFTGRQ